MWSDEPVSMSFSLDLFVCLFLESAEGPNFIQWEGTTATNPVLWICVLVKWSICVVPVLDSTLFCEG